jgi:molybdenum cofactor biosynthesis enzyme MoaA
MLTGGEPMIHPKLKGIIRGINCPDISVTSNGIMAFSAGDWTELKEQGLRMAVISIHGATPQSILQLETRAHSYRWAAWAIESQKLNLVAACQAGLRVRVNTVAYHTVEQTLEILSSLTDLQMTHRFEIRLLNDLTNIERSQAIITKTCQLLGAKVVGVERRAGSSNASVKWRSESGFQFSTKTAVRYFFGPICDGCPNRATCYEGFYGPRLERRQSDYWVRLCIYRHTPDVLMPWQDFLASEPSKLLRKLCENEQQIRRSP